MMEMEDEDIDFAEMMAIIVMDAGQKKARRDAAQQAVERVVDRVGRFNGDEVPNFLRAYNAEMVEWGVDEATRQEYFCRVVAVSIHKEVTKLQQAHESWVSFQEALLEAYGYERPKGRGRCEFDHWVASAKAHQSAMQTFLEFERRYAQLSERDQRLVGVDKVLLFVKSINRKEREAIGVQLEDDDGANGLMEDWAQVRRVCRQHDKEGVGILSATTWPRRDDRKGTICDDVLPPKEESLRRKGWMVHNMEALVREAYESLKLQVEAEGKIPTESKPRQMVDEEKVMSWQFWVNDVADTKDEVRYNGTTREDVEQATLLSCEGRSAKDKAEDSRATNAITRVDECFETHDVFETSSDEEASLRQACMFDKGKECDTYAVGEIATNSDIETKVAMGESLIYGGVKSSSQLVLETWVIVLGIQCEFQETKGVGGGVKVEASMYDKDAKQSTRKDNGGQAVRVDSKGVPREVITTSKVMEDTSLKIGGTKVNSSVRVNHKGGQNGKHAMWSSKGLKVSMYFKKGLHGVINVGVRMWLYEVNHERGKKEAWWKCLDQGDGRNEGGTCAVHEGLYSQKVVKPMTSGRGGKYGRQIWLIGWRWSFAWKEWTCSKWRTKNEASKAQGTKDSRVDYLRPRQSHSFHGTCRRMCGLVGVDVVMWRARVWEKPVKGGVKTCMCN